MEEAPVVVIGAETDAVTEPPEAAADVGLPA